MDSLVIVIRFPSFYVLLIVDISPEGIPGRRIFSLNLVLFISVSPF